MAFLSAASPPNSGSLAAASITPSRSLSRSSLIKKSRLPRRISCKSAYDDDTTAKLDRRNVLLGLGGLYGLAGQRASAGPILAPDLSECVPPSLSPGVKEFNCCPPLPKTIYDFKLQTGEPVRTRPAAHNVGDDYLAKFNLAMQRMRDLPDSDPRSLMQQANVHCAYCLSAYKQVNYPELNIQVHNSWLFFPFHRWFIYFFERILGNLIGDPTFAMPFWNWDAPEGMEIPAIYNDPKSPLYDHLRNKNHSPQTLIDLQFDGNHDYERTDEKQIKLNLHTMHRQMVLNSTSAKFFLGHPYRAGEVTKGAGSIEHVPHNTIHLWTGISTPHREDMGNFYSAGRDPIFYAHHANVDRMWNVWKTLPGGRQDFVDYDWLDSEFLFYDENCKMMKVKVRDCLDTKKLGYVYQDVGLPCWMYSKPTPRRLARERVSTAGKDVDQEVTFPPMMTLDIDKTVKILVKRPKRSRSKKEKAEEAEILLIEGIEFDHNDAIKFDVLINDDSDNAATPEHSEFAGSFVNVPHHGKATMHKDNLILNITTLLEDLEAEADESVEVTLVPKLINSPVQIHGVSIGLVSLMD